MADDAGEKMLTEDALKTMREAFTDFRNRRDVHPGQTTYDWTGKCLELLDHIAALSAAIKRLEIPVADGEVEAAIIKLELKRPDAPIGKQHYSLDEVVANMAEAALLLRRQAREIERLKAGLAPFAKVAIGFEDGEQRRVKHHADEGRAPGPPLPDCTEVRCTLGDCRKAAAALETREMKP